MRAEKEKFSIKNDFGRAFKLFGWINYLEGRRRPDNEVYCKNFVVHSDSTSTLSNHSVIQLNIAGRDHTVLQRVTLLSSRLSCSPKTKLEFAERPLPGGKNYLNLSTLDTKFNL